MCQKETTKDSRIDNDEERPRTVQAEESKSSEEILKEKIKKILRKHDVGDKFSHLLLPKASVLLPITIKDGELFLLFTVRSMELKSSPGDVCFPGGREEPADSDEVATALREAEEEVGLRRDQVEVISRLPPTITMAGYLVTPVVAFIDETFQPRSNPAEVADVFTVPLGYFLEPEKHSSSSYQTSENMSMLTHSFEYNDPQNNKSFKIWGLTAWFALVLAVLALEKKPVFNVGVDVEDLIPSCERFLIKSYEYKKSKL
ncbi:peroxisomal coenzyme A diphosphatase NUDT7 isoform X2 [Microcaecilia unicolor]|nr:peroxisomal coenzyme A diphosphatase NUDT7 isoform X2 [Microcaecilia unicolor]XP_030058501.1 peroxisomal coenzyme A diphosphatase NUDT7 isoform X2 [Microcaecilia unicolor]XP_030058502.1 peroxisomal coenzyme A diphosphatase NUDT7 isoform X2 [Microcaecilia unicolor]XP_030058503.1 peroxisomal coenzyme A diphosphatase NUDT7 isoform X2 [Microcaecilia unicolor]XP_030058504.1 peroxisomal coenzyme A diphosphatase NUDT7 isoform X2 [Microcaecilia unicolor]